MAFILGGGHLLISATPGVFSMVIDCSTVLSEDVIVVIVVFACGFITIRLKEPVVLITEEPGLTNWRDN